jgi:hypothetical protein
VSFDDCPCLGYFWACMVAGSNTVQNNALDIGDRFFNEGIVIKTPPHDGVNLHGKIRVVLRRRPYREDQMIRIDWCEFPCFNPGSDHQYFRLDEIFERRPQFVAYERGALNDFKTE